MTHQLQGVAQRGYTKVESVLFVQLGAEGKRLRPTILLLMASSLSAAAAPSPELLAVDLRPPATHITDHRRRQQRIAEVGPRCDTSIQPGGNTLRNFRPERDNVYT
jgi:geranylgeranyl pyrophosphate synthase